MRVAITGGDGFVGRAFVNALRAAGHEARVLRHGMTVTSGGDAVIGDVRDPAAVRALLVDCAALVHLAPGMRAGPEAIDAVVSGTRAVVEAAKAAELSRIVYLSCQGADASSHSPFHAACWHAETIVSSSGLPSTVIRSSAIVGPEDTVLGPLAELVRTLPIVPVVGDGQARLQPISVDDVARCLRATIESDALAGERISIGGPEFVTFRQLIDLVGNHFGVSRPKLLMPSLIVPAILALVPAAARVLYAEPRAETFRSGVVASPGAVEKAFGFEPISVISSLERYLPAG